MPESAATSAFHSARPDIRVNGEERPELTDGLLNLVVEERREGLYRCEATFGNWGTKNGSMAYLYLDREVLEFGRPFSVLAGDGDAEAIVFEGRITGLEAQYPQDRPPEITVLAEDRLQDLRMTRRTRAFEDVTDSDVFDRIAAAHGLRRRIDIDGSSHRVLAQVNQSDLAFLRDRALSVDAEVWIEEDTLFAQARSRLQRDAVTLEYGRRLRTFSVLADIARQRTSLAVSGWDTAAKESVVAEATASVLQPELNGFVSGPAVLEQTLGPRPERVVHMVPFSHDEARLMAESRFRVVGRRFLTGRGESEGDGRIRVGTRLTLERLGALFDGEYVVCQTRHTFDARSGFRTRFVVERAGLGTP